MKREIDVTIYNSGKGDGTAELWHADRWPQGSDGEIDLAHAMQGSPIAVRISRGYDTRAVHLTLDEALELHDALDMVRHRYYEPSEALIAKLKEGGKPTQDEIVNEMKLFEMAVIAGAGIFLEGADTEPRRKAWMTRKWDVLINIVRRRAGLE